MKLIVAVLLLPVLLSAQIALLSGRVTDGSGARVPGALVVVRSANRSIVTSGMTGADGAFRFEVPGSGTFSLNVTRAGFSPSHYSVTLERGKSAEVVVRLDIQPVG